MDLLCENDECKNEATTRYRWPWGDEGVVCDGHRVHTAQLAQQLGRDVAFFSLVAPTDAPKVRDASAELALAKRKLLEFEQENNTLKGQLADAIHEVKDGQLEREKLVQEHQATVTNLRAEMARRGGGVRAAQVDSDVEAAPTASTGPTESPRETQSQPKAPRR